MTTKMKTLHFSVSGDYVTNMVRELWADSNHEKALNILETIEGLTEEQRYDILEGKLKLGGINDLTLEEDDATEIYGMPLLSVKEMFIRERQKLEKEQERVRDHLAVAAIINGDRDAYVICGSPWGRLEAPNHVAGPCNRGFWGCLIPWDDFEERFPELVHRAKNWLESESKIKERYTLPSKPKEEKPVVFDKPELGNYKSPCGWLLPNGDYYPCMYGHHLYTLSCLDKDEKDVEKTWIKVQRSITGSVDLVFYFCQLKKVTQRQMDFIWDYCQHHGLEYPKEQIEMVNGVI